MAPDQSKRRPLHCGVAVYAVEDISPVESHATIVYRVYLFWEFKEPRLRPFLDRARAKGGRLTLGNGDGGGGGGDGGVVDEVSELSHSTTVPVVEVYNKVEEPICMDPATFRIYAPSLRGSGGDGPRPGGGEDSEEEGAVGRGWVMWNAQHSCNPSPEAPRLERTDFITQCGTERDFHSEDLRIRFQTLHKIQMIEQ